MPRSIIVSNVDITGATTSPSVRVQNPSSGAAASLTFTAPSDPAGFIAGQVEASATGTGVWVPDQRFAAQGGPGKDGGTNHITFSLGLAQYTDSSIRFVVTAASSGWTVLEGTVDW